MTETTAQFGADRALVGVVTDPERAANGLGLVFLDAGFTHHVGPHRLHVRLARRLAGLGYTSLRFDHSGIGDSPRRAGASSFAERAVAEARAALDFLEATRGLRAFALFGVCWGADNAVRIAAADARVAGVAAVDFYAVMSARYFARFYLRRLLSPHSWVNVLRGRSAVFERARQLVTAVARPGAEDRDGDDLLPVQSPAQVLREIEALVDRGLHLCFAYATVGGSYDRYVLDFRRRMRELAATGRLRAEVFGESDHIFTPLDSQRRLVEYVEGWASDLARDRGGAA